ncbi:glucosyltransferase domain-containing protein [Acerihabitans sp. KWT182]|uniref:Glucosyltransferase domain-containing protein n=1 Tax=Acerihabitans sp. KWT182 TaxID=3157919 RepID=A0AAU7Q858_9GAMM
MDVDALYLTVLGIKLNSVKVGLNPIGNGSAVKQNGESAWVVSQNGPDNQQLNVDFDHSQLHNKRILMCGTAGMLIAFIMLLLFDHKNTIYTSLNKADRLLTEFAQQARIDGCNFRELGILVFIGAIFYGYFLSTYSLSIDNEDAALRQHSSVWVSQGRWFTYLIEKLLLQQPSVPFAPYVILIVAFGVSYIALLKAHGYRESWRSYLAYPVFCAFPTWWAIGTFYSNIPALAIGLVLVSLSAYIYFGAGFYGNLAIHNSYAKNTLVVMMLACGIAAYQSLILLFAASACGILLTRCLHIGGLCRPSIKPLVMTLGKLILIVVMAIIMYKVINILMQRYIAHDSGYIAKAFFNYDKTLAEPFYVLHAIFKEQIAVYGGEAQRYGARLAIGGIIICLATLVILRNRFYNIKVRVLLWLGVLFIPFTLHLVTGGEPLPMRTLIPIAYVSWLSCIILLFVRRPIYILSSIILIILLQTKIIGVTSQYIASATIVQSHDRLLAADIYSRVGALSADFDPDAPLKMDFYGRKKISCGLCQCLARHHAGLVFFMG